MSTETFTHDVFLSHSSKDKTVVRAVAEHLRKDGPPAKAEGRRQKFFILYSALILRFVRSARTGRSWLVAAERLRGDGTPARSGFGNR